MPEPTMACDQCAATFPYQLNVTATGAEACDDCLRTDFWQCAGCDAWYLNSTTCDTCDDGCGCEECSHDGDGSFDGLIHDYGYQPRPVFHGDGPLYLGIEIEIETPYREIEVCAHAALEHLDGLGYLKEDGSVGTGFEIVTHPMSYDYAIAKFPWAMLDDLHRRGCAATSATGIHVHVSRTGFDNPCHVFRWMKFIYRNDRQVVRIARRESHEWARFDEHDRHNIKAYAKGTKGYERYAAINTRNDHTLELRVFASSLDSQEVQAALGLAHASIEYTRGISIADIHHRGGWSWSTFTAWVKQRPEYAPLMNEMEVRSCAY